MLFWCGKYGANTSKLTTTNLSKSCCLIHLNTLIPYIFASERETPTNAYAIVSPLSCVSCVPASCPYLVCFPVLVSCHYELSMFQLCLSRYVLITLCILVLSFEFDLSGLLVTSPVYPVHVSPALSCLVLP